MAPSNAVLARNISQAPLYEGASSQTVAFSHYNHLSAQLPVALPSGELVPGGVTEQARQCFTNLKTVIEGIDHSLDDVIRLTVMLTDIADLAAVDQVCQEFYGDYLPTRTNLAVAALPLGAAVQIEAVVSNGVGTIPDAPQAGDLVKVARNVAQAPSNACSTQSVAFSHYNNLSAQLPIAPETGALVAGGIVEQTTRCLANIKAIMEGIDAPFDDIVKITIHLLDLADLPAVDEVYSTFFPDSAIARTAGYLPARSIVAVSGLPVGARVQVEAVLSHGDGTPPQAVEDRHGLVIWAANTDQAPRDPMSTQSVAFSHYNNISALLPLDAAGALVAGGATEQAAQCLTNLKAIVESIGHDLADVVKVNVFVADLGELDEVQAAYAEYFPGGVPARRVVQVPALAEGVRVMMDAVVANAEGTPPRG